MSEEWRPVVGFEGKYEISSMGRVRSLARSVRYTLPDNRRRKGGEQERPVRGIILRNQKAAGYAAVQLGRGNCRYVHVMMLEAFVGPRPPGHYGAHGDDDKTRNVLDNLRWATPTENAADVYKNNRMPLGELRRHAKLKNADIPPIRAMLAAGKSPSEIARLYRVTRKPIRRIAEGSSWKHIPQEAPA